MNIREWHDKHGPEKAREVCSLLGFSYHYWKGLLRRANFDPDKRNVSHHQAIRIATASDQVTGDPITVIAALGMDTLPERIVGKVRTEKA